MSNFIRVLRNGTLYSTREIAKTNLEAQLGKLQDGEICLASYGASWDKAKTILGVVRTKGATPSYTIFDNEDIAGIVAKIGELDATVRGNLTEGDALETDKHVGVKVVEENGKLTSVTVVESDIASAKLLGTKTDASTVDTAFGRIAKEVAERTTAITNAINALDSSVAADAESNNQLSVLTGVTQTDGKLAEKTQVTLAAVAKTGSAADVATTEIAGNDDHVAVAGTNVSAQISSIATTLKTVEKNIANVEANALNYRTVKLTDDEVTALKDSNVKEAYKVVSYTGTWTEGTSTGTQVGDVIKIYKDSSVKEIYLGSVNDTIEANGTFHKVEGKIPEADLSLNYAYMKADGTYEMAKINVANFLRESEFKNGLQVINGEVSVKVAEGSEAFLTVDGNGVKLSGVQNAIGAAIDALTVTKSGTDGKVTVEVAQSKGLISGVTVSTSGLALDNAVVKNVTVNNVDATVSGNKATVTIDGADIAVADSYETTVYPAQFETKVGADNHIKAADKINAALKKTENTISVLATEVISNEKVTTAAVSKLAESAGVLGADSVIGYQKKTDANYISAATSVHDATVKLDAAITTVDDKITALGNEALKSLNGSSAITVSVDTANSKTVSLKLDSVKTDNALTVTDNGLYLSNVWDCGEY